MTLMGLCSEVRTVRASELLDYTNYEGDYEFEMGIGREPEFRPLLENPDILIFAWGATVFMMAHAAGIELDDVTTTWDKMGHPDRTQDRQGRHRARARCRGALHHQRSKYQRARPGLQLEHVNRIGSDAAPDWRRATTTTCTGSTSRAPEHLPGDRVPVHRRSGRDAATAGCLATGLRALNAVPAVNDLPPAGSRRWTCRC